MNEYLIFTPEGSTYAPNFDVDIDNCQLLGRITAHSVSEAMQNFCKENKWIKEAQFDENNFIVEQIVSCTQKEEILRVIDYLWDNEMKSFQELDYPNNHIFNSLIKLREIFGH